MQTDPNSNWINGDRGALIQILQEGSALQTRLDATRDAFVQGGAGLPWDGFERYILDGLLHRNILIVPRKDRDGLYGLIELFHELRSKLHSLAPMTPDVVVLWATEELRGHEVLDRVNTMLNEYEIWYKRHYLGSARVRANTSVGPLRNPPS
ncbi:hypothetical protein JCM10908_002701 [Rhodotorula pacifica]|uniref:uncharacterized protein n=1 Tax=Rhodotorula pacifica TaxID=1495444 RepID=UPI003179F96F